MRYLISLSLLLASLAALGQGPTPVAKPEDVKSINSIVHALYDVISGPAGAKHDWDRFRSLFTLDARLIAVFKPRTATIARIRTFTPEDYVRLSGAYIEKNGFFEREIARKTDQFANIAHLFSTYESRNKADDKKPFARGINSIQLLNDGSRWWVVTIYWQDEANGMPLPDKYLHNGP